MLKSFFILFFAPIANLAMLNTVFGADEKPISESDHANETEQTQLAKKEAVEVPIEQEQAREREKTSEEDPLAQRQTQQQDDPEAAAEEPSSYNLYASIRVRYQSVDGETVWNDGNSRFGIDGRWHYGSQKWIFGRAEAGINLLDEVSQIFGGGASSSESSHGDSIFTRLLYVGVETPDTMFTYGKNWSTYYQVAGFTDRFDVGGASAAGAFNAGTDGGATGTGRADSVIQTRLLADVFPAKWKLKPFMVNLQIQHGEPIPQVDGENYGTAVGMSAIVNFTNDISVGLAVNHADVINQKEENIINAGLQGNEQATVLGVRWFNENWYLSTVVADLRNHEATDEGTYFSGVGWEGYGRYNLYKKLWLVSGWNYLEPHSDQKQAGEYQIKYGVLGLRYALNEDFDRLVYLMAQLDDSSSEDGTEIGDVYTLGFRWDFK